MTSGRALRAAAGVLVALIAIQFVGPKLPNATAAAVDRPAALAESAVPRPVMAMLRRACYDCHSDETRWPWYARVAPASWLVISDVDRGRGQLNFSRWGQYNPYDLADKLDKMCEVASTRQMPLLQYRILHGEASLSDEDIASLCAWTHDESARLTRMGT